MFFDCKFSFFFFQSPPPRTTDSPQSAAQGGQGGNLSARLRALSARCMALVHATGERAERHLGRHKSASKRSARPCKQRSFSSGALPGLHDFQRRQLNPIYRDEDPDADPLDGEVSLPGGERPAIADPTAATVTAAAPWARRHGRNPRHLITSPM